MNTFYRYVTHACVPAYEAMGWRSLGPTSGHHGVYAQTMVIEGAWDEPPEPEGDLTANASGKREG